MPEEFNTNEVVTEETTKKKKVDLDGVVGAGALVMGGAAAMKLVSWAWSKAKPKVQGFAGKVANAGNEAETEEVEVVNLDESE